ncbi:hypothetical protein AVEN_91626-1, partial [Araneus ventricosus]
MPSHIPQAIATIKSNSLQYCYGTVMLLPCHDNLKVGNRDLQGFDTGWKKMTSDLGDKIKALEFSRIMVLSPIGTWIFLEVF